MSGSTKKKYCKLLHAITNHALLSVSEEAMQEEEVGKIIKAAQDSKLQMLQRLAVKTYLSWSWSSALHLRW